MLRSVVALIAVAASVLAQERSWREAFAEGQRLYGEGKIEEAANVVAEASRLAEASGLEPKDRAGIESALAQMLRLVMRTEEAETHRRKAVELLEAAVPPLDHSLATARVMLAGLEAENGRVDEAAIDACTALAVVQGEAPDLETVCLAYLARVSFGRRQYGTAMQLMKLAFAKVREAEPEPGSLSFGLGHAIAALALGTGGDAIAERMLAEIHQFIEKVRPNPADAMEVAHLAVELWIKQGRLEEAEQGARRALDLNAKVSGAVPIPVAALTTSLARVALAQDDLKRAAEYLAQAEPALRRPGYDTRSELSALLGVRAELRLRQRDLAAARADLEEALRLDSRDGEHGLGAARTLLALARVESEDGAHARAMDYAQRAARIFFREIGCNPEGRKAFETYGLLRTRALDAGMKEVPALKGMRLGEALEPDAADTDARARQMLAEAAPEKDAAVALARVDEALALRPGEPTAHAARARLLSKMDRHEDAAEAADAMIAWSLVPTATMYSLRATMSLKLRRHERVIVDTTYALLLGEADPMAHGMRGIAWLARDDQAELALRDFDVYVKAHPRGQAILHLRAWALYSLGRWDDARSAFDAAVAAGSEPGSAYAMLACIERCRGNIDLALAEAGRALEASPKGLEAYGVRGLIRLDRGEWKDALADIEAWAGDEPPSLYGRVLQWICRAHLGERDAAAEALRGAIAGEKEREDLKAVAQAILGDGPVPASEGPVPTSRKARERACETHFLLGAWREAEGDPAGAKVHYERAVAMEHAGCLEFHSANAALARLGGSK